VKRLAKKILPKPVIRYLNAVRGKFRYRDSPRIRNPQDNSGLVLECCIAYNKYGGYCVPLSSRHRPAAQRILAGEVWEPGTIEFLVSQRGDGDIVHAGTYFGDFLPALSRSCAPGAKVWAFEPNSENYRSALITTYVNGLQNIQLMNAGLGERQGSLFIVTADAGGRSLGGGSRIVGKSHYSNEEGSTAVKIVTIDEIVPSERKVSIIQLDVEGFEKSTLTGALLTIHRCKPIIILESLPEENWLSENILQLGYQMAGSVHGNTILRPGCPRHSADA
jgi:FkbM family methyltransferase